MVAIFLLSITVAQQVHKRCDVRRSRGQSRGEWRNDTLEFIETVVFSMQVKRV